MNNKFFNMTNEQLVNKVNENIKENQLILKEIFARQSNGRMKKPHRIEGSLIDYFKNEMSQKKAS